MSERDRMAYAKVLLEFLSLRDPLALAQRADLIVGFGHFDMRVPRTCASFYLQSLAPRILLTGGRGAGSADLSCAEGIAFRDEIRSAFPQIPDEALLVESKSTNTAENILFSNELLRAAGEHSGFSKDVRSIVAVATPYRQLRVALTMQKLFPDVWVLNAPPETDLETEMGMYREKGEDFCRLLIGELERIKTYPAKGFIAQTEIPWNVEFAYTKLLENIGS